MTRPAFLALAGQWKDVQTGKALLYPLLYVILVLESGKQEISKRRKDMPMVRLLEHGQVTIPKKFREALGLQKGDVAEAELRGEKIVITPKKLIKRRAMQKLLSLMDEVHQQNKGVGEKQVSQDVLKAIAELREEEYGRATSAKRRS